MPKQVNMCPAKQTCLPVRTGPNDGSDRPQNLITQTHYQRSERQTLCVTLVGKAQCVPAQLNTIKLRL